MHGKYPGNCAQTNFSYNKSIIVCKADELLSHTYHAHQSGGIRLSGYSTYPRPSGAAGLTRTALHFPHSNDTHVYSRVQNVNLCNVFFSIASPY